MDLSREYDDNPVFDGETYALDNVTFIQDKINRQTIVERRYVTNDKRTGLPKHKIITKTFPFPEKKAAPAPAVPAPAAKKPGLLSRMLPGKKGKAKKKGK